MPAPRVHRVLSVIHGPVFGGAHNQLLRLEPALRANGFETIALLPDAAADAARRFEMNGIDTIRLPLHSFRLSRDPAVNLRSLASARPDVKRLRNAIRSTGADIVQTHGLINVHAAVAAHLERRALAWQILDSRAPRPVRHAVMPIVLRTADVVTSWGLELARAHPGATALGERLVLIYPPVDPTLAPDPAARENARGRLGIPKGAPLVATLGVRNAQKGHEFFVRAAALVRSARPDAVFRVLGAPSPGHETRAAAVEAEAQRLGLTGTPAIDFVDPGPDATTLLQAADVFAMTSVKHSEGMPTAILEAMTLGKAVVATDVGSTRELVSDGETGVLVAPGDPDAIATALTALLSEAETRERMGDAAQNRAREHFGLEQLVERHVRAYRTAIAYRERR